MLSGESTIRDLARYVVAVALAFQEARLVAVEERKIGPVAAGMEGILEEEEEERELDWIQLVEAVVVGEAVIHMPGEVARLGGALCHRA